MEKIEILDYAVKKYGSVAQIEMLIEECSEVIQAVQKRKRLLDSGITENYHDKLMAVNYHLFEEIADLSIMIKQMYLIFPAKKIEEHKEQKILRLKKRLGI